MDTKLKSPTPASPKTPQKLRSPDLKLSVRNIKDIIADEEKPWWLETKESTPKSEALESSGIAASDEFEWSETNKQQAVMDLEKAERLEQELEQGIWTFPSQDNKNVEKKVAEEEEADGEWEEDEWEEEEEENGGEEEEQEQNEEVAKLIETREVQ